MWRNPTGKNFCKTLKKKSEGAGGTNFYQTLKHKEVTVKDEERNISVDRSERPEMNPYTQNIFDIRKAASQNTWSKKDFLKVDRRLPLCYSG